LELIERWRRGDQTAATELVERHAAALARFAASSGGGRHGGREDLETDIDDLVQDTFIRAFGALDGFRGESSFRTWLFSIERRLMLDRRRSVRRRPARVEVQEGDAATEYDALDSVVANETEGRLRDAVTRLSPTQRHVFVLRVTEGLSYRDIAEAAGTTEGAARVHYHNAVKALKGFLNE
jgi:RNA polymerase sigma-70 factor (ECF subfamily)